jgi:carbamoyltransferase
MRILGLQDSIDSAAAVIENGRIVAAMSEERIVREKLAYGFPRSAIRAVLKVAKLAPEDIDYVAVAGRNNYLVNEVVPFNGWFETRPGLSRHLFLALASKVSPLAGKFNFLEKSYYAVRSPIFAYRRWKIQDILRQEFGFSGPVAFIDHHFAHACSAYYSAGYEDATVVTLDGGGPLHAACLPRTGVFNWRNLCGA